MSVIMSFRCLENAYLLWGEVNAHGLLFLIGQNVQTLFEAEQRAAIPPVLNALETVLGICGPRSVSLEEAIIIFGVSMRQTSSALLLEAREICGSVYSF